MDMRKWFKEAQYGMMVHWGLYSLLAGEYKDCLLYTSPSPRDTR